MWTRCFLSMVVFVVAFQNVSAQDYSNFYKRLDTLRRPVIISARTGQRIFYVGRQTDLHSKESQETSSETAPKVRIDVYYETDCPDSARFITTQLYRLYQEMGDILDIHLHPYGKAYRYWDNEKHKYQFSCQHGASECYGNRVQACALKLYPDMDDAINFINCMESYPRPSQSGQKCARRHSLNWSKIEKCATGELGEQLTNKLADETENLNPNLYFVPWIVFDKVFDRADFRIAQRNLKGVVCRRYKGHHPSCAKA